MGAKLVDRAAGIQSAIRMVIFVQWNVVFPFPQGILLFLKINGG
jgi:hypothetical protein